MVRTGVLAVAGLVVAAGAVAVYLSLGRDGNRGEPGLVDSQVPLAAANAEATGCAEALATAEEIDPLAIGQMAALRVVSRPTPLGNLAFTRGDGTPVSIADFAGTTILLNLWATWCPPCRAEMPALNQLAAEFEGRPFQVVALNTLETAPRERPAEFLTEIGVEALGLFLDPNSLTFYEMRRQALTVGLPTTVLIDENGCAVGIMEGPADWASPEAFRLIETAIGA